MLKTRSAFASALRDGRGSVAVEFAVLGPIMLTAILGILLFGVAYYQGATVQWSLERSLRAAMIDGDISQAEIEERMADDLARIGNPEINLAYEVDDSGAVPLAITSAHFEVPIELPFFPTLTLPFSAENVTPVPQD